LVPNHNQFITSQDIPPTALISFSTHCLVQNYSCFSSHYSCLSLGSQWKNTPTHFAHISILDFPS
jgi:hypothetical protein